MRIDNFDLIRDILKEDDQNYFYQCQVLRRGKDHPELPSANWCAKSIYISGKNGLDKHKDEIIKLCEVFEARAYISLTRFSNKDVMMNMIRCLSNRVYTKDYKKPQAIWQHCVDTSRPEERGWIVDVDFKDPERLKIIKAAINAKCPPKYTSLIQHTIPTIDGYHIYVHPFDSRKFLEIFPDIEIKKHGLTLLYA